MLSRSASRFVASSIAAACTLLLASPAFARPTGIIGYSGKTANKYCATACHNSPNGAAVPGVTITGPDTLNPGQSAEYQVTITTNQPKAGTDIAATDGITLAPGNGLKLDTGEITHTAPQDTANGMAVFKFTVTAPNTPQAIMLYAAGNAVDGNADTAGDNSATATKSVQVMAAVTAMPDAGSAGGTPSGPSSGGDGGTVSPNGTGGGPGPNVERRPAPDGGAKPFSAGSDEPYDPTFAETGLSCAVSRGSGGSAPIEPSALALVGFALLAASVRRATRSSREDA